VNKNKIHFCIQLISMKIKSYLTLLLLLAQLIIVAQSKVRVPSIKETHSILVPSNPQISPDGQDVVFQVRSLDWEANRFDTEFWISKKGSKAFPLTNNPKSSSYDPKWSPDGKWISFFSDRGEGTQIQVIRADGGEAFRAIKVDGHINNYQWSPDGTKIAYLMDQKSTKEQQSITEQFGEFEIDDEEGTHSWLYMVDFNPGHINQNIPPCSEVHNDNCFKWGEPIALIDSVDFTIYEFKWSPDGTKIAFDKQPNSLINTYLEHADIGIVDVESKKWEVLVNNTGADFIMTWSPDSRSIGYYSSLDDHHRMYYANGYYFTIDIHTKEKIQLAKNFDEEFKNFNWTKNGIYALASQKTKVQLFLINPSNGNIQQLSKTPDRIYEFSISKDGSRMAFLGDNDESLKEIYSTSLSKFSPKLLSSFSNQMSNWKVGTSEVISWNSKDGTPIEGILHKPDDYDSSKKYPLLIVVHGGPTMTDRPTPIPAFYPIVQWINKGALVLRPNYRGSGGYGEKFRSLNVGNLGIGDGEDILSGIDHLATLDMIDTTKIACMGWSMGGFSTAFLATTTGRFKAVSVGAGITNWKTHYATTDLHPFTQQYLKATPWSNPEIYEKTSPMTYITEANTPTLIQHCKYDQRVPIANAYELLQGLRDMGVDTKLVIYDVPGHIPSKPKERLAGAWHNWQWFGKYIFEEEIKLK